MFQLVTTPGFMRACATDVRVGDFVPAAYAALEEARRGDDGDYYDFVVGTPTIEAPQHDGDEFTIKLPCTLEVWAKLDVYPEGPVITFLLPSEY